VNNDYADPFLLENPPPKVDISKLQRNILADKPRITRFPIDWSPSGQHSNNNDENAMGFSNETAADLEMDAVEEDDMVKAAAQLDHNYTDIVIENGENEMDYGLDDGLEIEEGNEMELDEDSGIEFEDNSMN
jgi:histone chaperone ASF1